MILIKVVPDQSMAVPGFARHTLQCSSCGEVEGRLMFSRARARSTEAVVEGVAEELTEDLAVHAAPPISPASMAQPGPATSGLFDRIAAKLRGRHDR